MSSKGFGWHTIDLKDAVKNWVSRPETNKGFKLIIKDLTNQKGKPAIEFAMERNNKREAILVVYSDDRLAQQKEASRNNTTNKRNTVPDQGTDVSNGRRKRNTMESGCRRVDMKVDIEKINWDRWILQPRVFNAYRCVGECGVFSSKQSKHQTNHATVQAILSETQSSSNSGVNSPCCAPKELDSMTMLLFERTAGSVLVKLQTMGDIRVRTCACL